MRREENRLTKGAIAKLMVIVCCVAVVLTQHAGTDILVSGCNYLIIGLLLLGLGISHFIIHNRDNFISFFLVTNILSLFVIICINLGNDAWFSAFAAIKGQIIYVLFVASAFFVAEYLDDADYPLRIVHSIAVVACWIVVIQYVAYIAGVHLNRIPFLGEYIFHATDNTRLFRPAAFFAEPSYFAEVVVIDLFNNLFIHQNYKRMFLNVVAIALTASGVGILVGAAMVLAWILMKQISNNAIINISIKSISGIIFALIVYSFIHYEGQSYVINRLLGGATVSQRTYRAFELFGILPPVNKWFGIGMQNVARYLNGNGIFLVNDRQDTLINREFMQSFGYLLCTLGLAGSFSTFWCFGKLVIKLKDHTKLIIVFLLALMLVANIITRQIFILWMIVAVSLAFNSDNGEASSKIAAYND